MARPLRVQFENAIYHVTIRGNARGDLFLDDRDRLRFLDALQDSVDIHGIRLFAYCQMTNHVHLVVKTPHANLSDFMHGLQTRYTVYFNRRQGRSGHVVQGRYKAILVGEDEYLLKLCCYVHLNPVRTEAMKNKSLKEKRAYLVAYPWSSYQAYIGKAQKMDWADYMPLERLVDERMASRRGAFRRYVEADLAQTDEEFLEILKGSHLALGSDEFVTGIRRKYEELLAGAKRKEDVTKPGVCRHLPTDVILGVVCSGLGIRLEDLLRRRGGAWMRGVAARMLTKYGGMTQRQVADHLGIGTGAAVSIRLKDLRAREEQDWALRRSLNRIEETLQGGG